MKRVGEKQLAELCMLNQKTVKRMMNLMMKEGFVQSGYIPRTSNRDTAQSLFLWYIDWPPLHKKVLQSLYNAVSNLLVKRRDIKQKQAIVAEEGGKDSKEEA